MNRIEVLRKAVAGVRFSPPQKRIVERLLNGDMIEVVNKHYLSGGEWMWSRPDSENLEPAGKVYKAFWNVFYQIQVQSSINVSASLFIK